MAGLVTSSPNWPAERRRVLAYVTHCKRGIYDVYGGRPGALGNPFVVGRDGTREQVIARFEEHLLVTPALLALLPDLRGKIIGCWCAPRPCHCDVLAWYANCWEGMSQMDKEAELNRLYNDYATTLVLQEVALGKRMVRGCGPLDSPLVVVGEAPGAQEDEQGKPFVGASGQLLQKLFADAGLPWDLCYVMNVLPWRPPGNRTPFNYEIIASYRRVRAEIELIDPRAVVMAGATAWRAVTQNDYGHFSEHHGHGIIAPPEFSYGLVCVRHPGALLRASATDRAKMEAETVRSLRTLMAGADA